MAVSQPPVLALPCCLFTHRYREKCSRLSSLGIQSRSGAAADSAATWRSPPMTGSSAHSPQAAALAAVSGGPSCDATAQTRCSSSTEGPCTPSALRPPSQSTALEALRSGAAAQVPALLQQQHENSGRLSYRGRYWATEIPARQGGIGKLNDSARAFGSKGLNARTTVNEDSLASSTHLNRCVRPQQRGGRGVPGAEAPQRSWRPGRGQHRWKVPDQRFQRVHGHLHVHAHTVCP